MVKIKTLQPVRLRGADIPVGTVIDLDDPLRSKWIGCGYATEDIAANEPVPEPVESEPVPEPVVATKSKKVK